MLAHPGEPLEPHDLWTAWQFDPAAVALLLLSIAALSAGRAAVARRHRTADNVCFWSGWTVLALALVSPLHPLGEALFSAHMVQHEILMLVAAPLLVLSRPLVPLLWGLPFEWRSAAGRWSKARWHSRHVGVVHHEPVNGLVHSCRGAVGLACSRMVSGHASQRVGSCGAALQLLRLRAAVLVVVVLCARSASYGAGVLYLFTTAVHTSILGALLTFAPDVWYPAYSGTRAGLGPDPARGSADSAA